VLCLTSATLLLATAACSADTTRVEVSYGDFINEQNATSEISVSAGTSFEVALFSNPTTGFQWEEAEISDTSVLQQKGRRFVSLRGEPDPPPGSPGQDVWTFGAADEGQSTVTFRYSRPWEGGQRGVWTFTLTVNVV